MTQNTEAVPANEAPLQRAGRIALSIIYVLFMAAMAAWVFGLLMGVIDGMRTSGTHYAAAYFPYFDPTAVSEEPFHKYARGSFAGEIENLINLNNMYFRGATRFGSGLGCVAGAIYAATTFPFKSPVDRFPAIAVAGLVVGARSMLMIASAPISAVIGGCICAAVALVLALIYMRDNRAPRMPIITFVR